MASDYRINKKIMGRAQPTPGQKVAIAAILKKKYPQMYGGGVLTTKRSQQITDQLKRSGLTDEQIQKMRGKKR